MIKNNYKIIYLSMIPRDEQIWNTIGNKKHCSFKTKTPTVLLCRNPYNVNGLCEQKSCPLSNSKYATVREDKGELFLFIKEPERISKPSIMYEKILLNTNYEEALKELETHLLYWDEELIKKCKRKMTKLYKYLINKKDLIENKTIKLEAINKRKQKIERAGALLTLKDVTIHSQIEKELINRLKSGMYGKEIEDEVKIKDEANIIKNTKRKFIAEFEESDQITSKVERKKKYKSKETIMW